MAQPAGGRTRSSYRHVIDQKDMKYSDKGGNILILRSVLRAEVPAGVRLADLENRLSDAIAAAVKDVGGTPTVLRVAHVLDLRWSTPLDPVPNRAEVK